MTIENKVTSFRPQSLSDDTIQEHLDMMNAQGYKLVTVDNLVGWYRFFWEKEVQ